MRNSCSIPSLYFQQLLVKAAYQLGVPALDPPFLPVFFGSGFALGGEKKVLESFDGGDENFSLFSFDSVEAGEGFA